MLWADINRYTGFDAADDIRGRYMPTMRFRGLTREGFKIRFNSCFIGNGSEGEAFQTMFAHAIAPQGATLYSSRVQILPNFAEFAAFKLGVRPPDWLRAVGEPLSVFRGPLTTISLFTVEAEEKWMPRSRVRKLVVPPSDPRMDEALNDFTSIASSSWSLYSDDDLLKINAAQEKSAAVLKSHTRTFVHSYPLQQHFFSGIPTDRPSAASRRIEAIYRGGGLRARVREKSGTITVEVEPAHPPSEAEIAANLEQRRQSFEARLRKLAERLPPGERERILDSYRTLARWQTELGRRQILWQWNQYRTDQ